MRVYVLVEIVVECLRINEYNLLPCNVSGSMLWYDMYLNVHEYYLLPCSISKNALLKEIRRRLEHPYLEIMDKKKSAPA